MKVYQEPMQWIFLSMDGLISRVHGCTGATSVFAIYYNAIHDISDHVWQSHFWSKIIDDIKQLFDTFNYICDNPVKAEMIKNAEEYKYGGLYYILKGIYDIVDRPELDYFLTKKGDKLIRFTTLPCAQPGKPQFLYFK